MPIRELAPTAWSAILDVVGCKDRLETKVMHIKSSHFTTINSLIWCDAFIVNFHRSADKPWQPPPPQVSGWHKDGSYFRHFLDSREHALNQITVVFRRGLPHAPKLKN